MRRIVHPEGEGLFPCFGTPGGEPPSPDLYYTDTYITIPASIQYTCTTYDLTVEPDETYEGSIYCMAPCMEMEDHYLNDFYLIMTARQDLDNVVAEGEAQISFKSKFRDVCIHDILTYWCM